MSEQFEIQGQASQMLRGVARERRFLEALIVLCVSGLSMLFFLLKLNGLHFHTRDFPYYANKYMCLLGDTCGGVINLNPNGRNFMGFHGVDGYPMVTNDIHFSPAVWLISGLYQLSQSLFVLQAIWAAAAAALALIVFRSLSLKFSMKTAALLTLVLLAIPSFPHWATDDLTVLPLLEVAILFVGYALLIKSPSMALVGCLLMGVIREEAIVMTGIAAIWLIVMEQRMARALIVWSAALFLLAFSYSSVQGFVLHGWSRVLVTGIAILAIGTLAFKRSLVPEPVYAWARRWRFVLIPLSLSAPFIVELKNDLYRLDIDHLFQLLFLEPQFYVFDVLVFMALVFGVFAGDISRIRRAVGLSAGVIFFGSMTSLFVLKNWQIFAMEPHYLHEVARVVKENKSKVLTDYAAYQAFLGYQDAFVYLRLPGYKFPEHPGQRFYPQNKQQLEAEIRDWADVIISGREPYSLIRGIVEKHWKNGISVDCGSTVMVVRRSAALRDRLVEICPQRK